MRTVAFIFILVLVVNVPTDLHSQPDSAFTFLAGVGIGRVHMDDGAYGNADFFPLYSISGFLEYGVSRGSGAFTARLQVTNLGVRYTEIHSEITRFDGHGVYYHRVMEGFQSDYIADVAEASLHARMAIRLPFNSRLRIFIGPTLGVTYRFTEYIYRNVYNTFESGGGTTFNYSTNQFDEYSYYELERHAATDILNVGSISNWDPAILLFIRFEVSTGNMAFFIEPEIKMRDKTFNVIGQRSISNRLSLNVGLRV